MPFLQTAANESAAKLSPDGRYIAYMSDETGRDEIFVRPFPAGGRNWPISTNGGRQVRWRRDGRTRIVDKNYFFAGGFEGL